MAPGSVWIKVRGKWFLFQLTFGFSNENPNNLSKPHKETIVEGSFEMGFWEAMRVYSKGQHKVFRRIREFGQPFYMA